MTGRTICHESRVIAFVALHQNDTRASTKIGEIVTVIDSIAFQTNLLALNAAGASRKINHVGQSIEQVSTMISDVSGAANRQGKEIDHLSRTTRPCWPRPSR